MNGHEGFRRVAQVVMGFGWILAALMCILAIIGFANHRSDASIVALIVGAIGWGVAKAIAWIIHGFASPRR